ncbi:MAG: voltage-gated potassium channel [Cocleimonas sp.]|jgi:voltage-gated potassium channel
MPHPARTLLRRLKTPLLVLLVVYTISIIGYMLIPGVDDKGQPWQMGFFHAFYFVSFMSTTIGFGEIPYPFTDQQRYWTLVSMYATVITWLYGIGVLLSVFQDKIFLNQIRKSKFSRRIKKIKTPFYIICGYGDTGVQLTRLLSEQGLQTVVIDTNAERIHAVEDDAFKVKPIPLCDDASQSKILEMAGITHSKCIGIISIVNDDNVNLTVAIVAQLLNPKVRLIARAETPEAEANILSFGANEVINPFNIFASRLALAMQSPNMYCLYDWMTGEPNAKMKEPPNLKAGTWIICDFGRFGRALYKHLDSDKVDLKFIESNRDYDDLPLGTVIGRATEAPSLKKAGIDDAVGIIAGTNNDANNLSIMLTASELNKDIFRVVRQNKDNNSHLFQVADYEMLMQRGAIISNTIFALIRTPLLGDFLRITSRFKNEKAGELVSRIAAIVEDDIPKIWEFSLTQEEAPTLFKHAQENEICLQDLFIDESFEKNNGHKISALCLFIKRDQGNVLLPERKRLMCTNDRLLFCGTRDTYKKFTTIMKDDKALAELINN